LPRYSEASSWPDYARCLTRESCKRQTKTGLTAPANFDG
jgi:hypothetical protein